MKDFRIIVLLVLAALLSSFNLSAQSPGYMGKHFLIKGNSSYSVRWKLEYWIKYGGAVEYVISKNTSIGFGYLFNKKTVMTPDRHDDFLKYPSMTLRTHTFSIDIYKYNFLAPLGDFIRISPFFMYNYSPDYYINGVAMNDNVDIYSVPKYTDTYMSNTNWGLTFFWGRRRIIKDIFSVSYGLKFGLTYINPLTVKVLHLNNDEGSVTSMDNTFNYTAHDNFFSTFLSFDVNIGFVL